MQGRVTELFHYPVKGLSAQSLPEVTLQAGHGFPLDRAFGFARPGSGFDPEDPKPLPKSRFVVLARDAGLAHLETQYDAARNTLSIVKDGTAETFDLAVSDDRQAASALLARHLAYPAEAAPTLYSAEPHKFTDVSVVSPAMMNAVSLINVDSVAHFSATIGAEVSPARFRGNILFEGIPALAELEWVARHLRIGEVTLRVVLRTRRCPATQVNLETAERDLDVPQLLKDHYGHSDMGVYAEVVSGGTIRPGDAVSIV